jgi:hypothetical protein
MTWLQAASEIDRDRKASPQVSKQMANASPGVRDAVTMRMRTS